MLNFKFSTIRFCSSDSPYIGKSHPAFTTKRKKGEGRVLSQIYNPAYTLQVWDNLQFVFKKTISDVNTAELQICLREQLIKCNKIGETFLYTYVNDNFQ